jgi:hypothetical protein
VLLFCIHQSSRRGIYPHWFTYPNGRHKDVLSVYRAVDGEKSWAVRSSFCIVAQACTCCNRRTYLLVVSSWYGTESTDGTDRLREVKTGFT